MLTKTKIALSARLAVDPAAAASADGSQVNRAGDRYPLLAQAARQPAGEPAFASAGHRHPARSVSAAKKTLFERALGSW